MAIKISTISKKVNNRLAPVIGKYEALDKKIASHKDKSKDILVRCKLTEVKAINVHLYSHFGKKQYGKNGFYVVVTVHKMKTVARITISKILTVNVEEPATEEKK